MTFGLEEGVYFSLVVPIWVGGRAGGGAGGCVCVCVYAHVRVCV